MSLRSLRHPWRLFVLAGLLLVTPSWADSSTVSWEPERIPDPSLEGMEPKVREQLRTTLDEVRRLRRSSSTPTELGNAYGELGRLYLAYDLTEPAAACLRNASRLADRDLRWAYLLGTIAQAERRLEEAEKSFHAALGLDPNDPDWNTIGHDWVKPANADARTRLYARLFAADVDRYLSEAGASGRRVAVEYINPSVTQSLERLGFDWQLDRFAGIQRR